MRIAVDVMGGDHGPGVVVDGVKQALAASPHISKLFLVGKPEEIETAKRSAGLDDSRVEIHPATEVLLMEDKPVEGLRRKKDCSILRAVEMIKDGKADALISTGNTGGIVAAATIRLRPLAGADRPGIATIIPTPESQFVLLDSGANVECRPSHLLHYAVMGNVYAREILGCRTPRVGLLSNGTEDNKGNELTLEALKLCRQANLNFIGNVEGHDLFNNRVDVVVCDGFVGNIVLKTIESFAKGMVAWLKSELSKNPKRMIGAYLARNALLTIKRRMDPDAHGGAPLLGLNGVVMKCHASASARAVMNAVRVCTEAVQHNINDAMRAEIARANESIHLPSTS